MMDKHRILAIHVTDRMKKACNLQSIFSEYGCNIKTRIGLHDVSGDYCSPSGVILLELFGDDAVCDEMKAKLEGTEGLEVQEVVFTH